MTVQITLKQTNTVEEGATPDLIVYKSANEIVAAEGVELQLFVYTVEPDVFSHVATPYDLEQYPDNKADAISEGLTHYRRVDATKTFERLDVAEDFISGMQSRVRWLANVLDRIRETFTGEQTTTYTAG